MLGFLDELAWRGLLHQTTAETLPAYLATPGRIAYAGFDPTADSLTVGNYVPMKLLAHWQRAGHCPVVLMGGGTGLIGDPSGKSAERQLMTPDLVAHNVSRQRAIFERVIDFSQQSERAAKVVDNREWLRTLGYLDVLRDVGKHFSVNQMIMRDSVKSRLEEREQGISYTEFSYMILQAYDFLHLFRTMGCTVQLGGADQWGNIVSGIDLIRRIEQGEAYGITNPLVTKADGGKFGKSEKGSVWLTADRTSPFRFHQYWLNTADADVVRFLKWFTFLPQDRIAELERAAAERPQEREAQRVLANEMTEIFHGVTERSNAEAAGRALYSGELAALDARTIGEIAEDLPCTVLEPGELGGEGILLADLLARTTLAASKREARDFLQAGAVLVNGTKAAADARLTARDMLHGHVALLRRGKKNWHAIRAGV
ncbi:MAG: tyrosine--tRNA ligase [Planctomycetota bacterium]|nr:tyrosine--tRNA ligase [Planctomycetota bacterium]